MQHTRLIFRINLIFFVAFVILNLLISPDPPIWIYFPDAYDYLRQSKIPLDSIEFFIPHKTNDFFPRPFTIPLFYKLVNSDPDLIVALQKILHSLSVFFLVYSFLQFLKTKWIKIFSMCMIYLLMSWWNIVGWTTTLLSESISMSLLFSWIASFLLLFPKRNIWILVSHAMITLLLSFTRDSWPYLLITFYAFVIAISLFQHQFMIKKSVAMLIFSVLLFFIQQYSAKFGQRYRLPLVNTIVLRIMTVNSHFQWFVRNGMPQADKLKKQYHDATYENKKIYSLYNDSTYTNFFNWVNKYGQTTYVKFLITHPSYTLLLQESSEATARIFQWNLPYTNEVNGYCLISHYVFPVFNWLAICFITVVLLVLYVKNKEFIYAFIVILVLLFTLNVFIIYNADYMETERHLFITTIVMQLVGILSISILIEYFTQTDPPISLKLTHPHHR